MPRQLVKNVGSGRNRIRTVKERPPRELRCSNKANGSCFIARNFPILAGSDLCFLNSKVGGENFCRICEVVTSLQGNLIRLSQLRAFGKLAVNPVERIVQRTIVEPVKHAEREEVFTTVNVFARKLHITFQRVHVERCDWQLMHAIAREGAILKRI